MKVLLSLVWLFMAPILVLGAVIEATDKTFDSLVNSGTPALVEFYAPWCGHCKTLEPTYEELGKLYVSSQDNTATRDKVQDRVNIIKIDGDTHRKISKRFSVRGYPTLLWFNGDGDYESYTGRGRELEDLTSFIESKTGIKPLASGMVSNIVKLNTKADLDHILMDSNKGVFVAVTATWCGHCKTLLPVWEQLAGIYQLDADKILIAKLDGPSNSDFTKAYGIGGYPTLLFYPPLPSSSSSSSSSSSPSSLSSSGKRTPLIWETGRDLETFVRFINGQVSTFRNSAGELNQDAGVIHATGVEDILSAIYNQPATATATAPTQEFQALVNQLSQYDGAAPPDAMAYYLRVAHRIQSKGPAYVSKEATRLRNILGKKPSQIRAQKRDELTQRANVLDHYLAAGSRDVPPSLRHDEL